MKVKHILTLITAILISVEVNAGAVETDPPSSAVATISKSLIDKGYEVQMINDLFGDEYFYFPKSDSELDLSFYIVEKIIDNGQYTTDDRDKLKNLAADAYTLYLDLLKEKIATKLE